MTDYTPHIERCDGLVVVRDDLVPGGTKEAALMASGLIRPGRVYVYASPATGFAQVALSRVCAQVGARAVVFVPKRNDRSDASLRAVAAGGELVEVPFGYMSVLRARAREFVAVTACAELVPFGVRTPEVFEQLVARGRVVRGMLDGDPGAVWVATGSGTLATALAAAFPESRVHAVRVGAHPDVPAGVEVHQAPERFEEAARRPPPGVPSNLWYDAKVWRYLARWAAEGDLWWNVAS